MEVAETADAGGTEAAAVVELIAFDVAYTIDKHGVHAHPSDAMAGGVLS